MKPTHTLADPHALSQIAEMRLGAMRTMNREIARLRKENEALRANGEFLLARLDELEWCEGRLEKTLRDFMGHVDPAVERFRAVLCPKDQAT